MGREYLADENKEILQKKLFELMSMKGWSERMLAENLGIDPSYLWRILHNERNPGSKFILGLIKLCKKEGYDIYDFINI